MAGTATTGADEAKRDFAGGSGLLALWTGLLAGPFAFLLDLEISLTLVPWVCHTGRRWVLLLVTALALLGALGGAAVARWCLGRLGDAGTSGDRIADRSRFMAVAGVVLSLAFAVLIVGMAIPRLVLGVCD